MRQRSYPSEDDSWNDIQDVFRQRDKKSNDNSPADDGINWDDYNFDFDQEETQPPVYPRTSYDAPQATQDYNIENMRRLHEGISPAAQPNGQYPPEYAQGYGSENSPQRKQPPRKRRKKKSFLKFLLWLILILAALAAILTAAIAILSKMPRSEDSIGVRKDGCATILLAGTDEEGTRTDTLMLLYIDRENKQLRLLSIPRDTMVNRDNPVPKVNGAYAANGSGEEGMDVLMDYIKDLIGYRPDGYMLINLDCFVDLVDMMGGVTFDVPMDMYYNDPTQDLYIDLKEGTQKLSGQEAMWLVRFRSGYAMADLERVNVQREFLTAAMSQWSSPLNLLKLPSAFSLLSKNTLTDLSTGNLAWIAASIVRCGTGNMETSTLPGEPAMVNGGAYYVEDREEAAALINKKFNPYESEITAYDLHPYGY